MNILVIGLGSMGKRRIRLIKELYPEFVIYGVDGRQDRCNEVKELFNNSSRMVRRAIMANTLEKMPVFFKTSQEVADYVMASLIQCNDEAEKYASKQLILEMIQ